MLVEVSPALVIGSVVAAVVVAPLDPAAVDPLVEAPVPVDPPLASLAAAIDDASPPLSLAPPLHPSDAAAAIVQAKAA